MLIPRGVLPWCRYRRVSQSDGPLPSSNGRRATLAKGPEGQPVLRHMRRIRLATEDGDRYAIAGLEGGDDTTRTR
jgi:hypothetical protein